MTEELCEACGGSGKEIIGENRVTLDMAIDAGDRNLEGQFHSYEYGPCSYCHGTGSIQQADYNKITTGPAPDPFSSI